MISGRIVHLHMEQFSETPEERGNELRASVACRMSGNTVFGEDVNKEIFGELWGVNMPIASKQDNLLGRPIDYNANCIITARKRKKFDEIDGNGVPRA